jgi:hypothetical protein
MRAWQSSSERHDDQEGDDRNEERSALTIQSPASKTPQRLTTQT